jgi:hypothetical protein
VQLLEDPDSKVDKKRKRKEVLQQFSFSATFGVKSGQRQKKPKIAVEDYAALVEAADEKQEQYGEQNEHGPDKYALKHEHEFAAVCARAICPALLQRAPLRMHARWLGPLWHRLPQEWLHRS